MKKYNNKSSVINGQYFPSVLEAITYQELCKLSKISSIDCQYPIKLTNSINWVIDFRVTGNNKILLIEAKGFITDVFRLKFKLLSDLHPQLLPDIVFITNNNQTLKKLKKLHHSVFLVKHISEQINHYMED